MIITQAFGFQQPGQAQAFRLDKPPFLSHPQTRTNYTVRPMKNIMQTRLSIIVIAATLVSTMIAVAEDSPITSNETSSDNSPSTIATSKKQGAETAAKDIKNGTLRILYFGKPWSVGKPLVDEVTGYRVLIVGGCDVSSHFVAEVEGYNSTMRQWHAKEKPKTTPK